MSKLYRTYSSPSLRGSPRQVDPEKNMHSYFCENDDNDNHEFYVIGDRVFVDNMKAASVAYFGEVEFASGDWVGVVMDNPLGNHNGKVHGREYFQCAPFHGLFVRPHRVTRMPDSALGHGRASTPLPTFQQRPQSATGSRRSCGVDSPSASSVTTDSSYFYDDDYRQSRLPTIASLGQRMDEIETNSRPQSRSSSSFRTATPPIGILKKSPSYRQPTQMEPEISSNETRWNRHQPEARFQAKEDPKEPVFNFRPRRAKLQHDLHQTGSAGILSDVSNRATTKVTGSGGAMVDLSSEPVQVGDRVWVRSERGDISGVLRFMGETNFATGEWAGVELDQAEGKNDGTVLGFRYFDCPQKHGLFVPATRVRKHDGQPGFKAMRSTIKSPPPLESAGRRHDIGSSNEASRSMTPSSYYNSSNKTTPSPSNNEFGRHFRSTSSSNLTSSPNEHDPRYGLGGNYMDIFEEIFGTSHKLETPKFSDNDIEYQLKRSLRRNNAPRQPSPMEPTDSFDEPRSRPRPRCVKYTFSSSKYDGNPIARRTVEYD